jgi:hypothetical protein
MGNIGCCPGGVRRTVHHRARHSVAAPEGRRAPACHHMVKHQTSRSTCSHALPKCAHGSHEGMLTGAHAPGMPSPCLEGAGGACWGTRGAPLPAPPALVGWPCTRWHRNTVTQMHGGTVRSGMASRLLANMPGVLHAPPRMPAHAIRHKLGPQPGSLTSRLSRSSALSAFPLVA